MSAPLAGVGSDNFGAPRETVPNHSLTRDTNTPAWPVGVGKCLTGE